MIFNVLMKNELQSDLANACIFFLMASMIAPVIMLLGIMVLFDSIWNDFTIKCLSICTLFVVSFIILERIKAGTSTWFRLGWLVAIAYFAWVIAIVVQFFDEHAFIFFFAAPEIAGVAIAFIGLCHSIPLWIRDKKQSEQDAAEQPPSAGVSR